ncbi:hypothetical protein SRB5_57770 [Streptomyces sp. RB5]|uniref:Uncharacterized protein n=1 Tax=Streptomyces smaragdinus TaxID=2585196 RepID=A0A7K0CQJ4_9ACTN|nr:DUF6585 family protein [Streptomyces smaragdinus]MQY15593.1 hypothetical protein [Streptomyces smaragdinus]
MSGNMPAEVAAVAQRHGLGEREAWYGAGSVGADWARVIGGVGFLVFAAVIAGEDMAPVTATLGIGGLVLLLWGIIPPVVVSGRAFHVFEHGFVHASGASTTVLPDEHFQEIWASAVDHYTNGVYQGTSHDLRLVGADGRTRIDINERYMHDDSDLVERVHAKCAKIMLDRYGLLLGLGAPVAFGPLALSTEGIHRGGEVLEWSGVGSIGLDQGVLRIEKRGKMFAWAKFPVDRIPNFRFFLAVALSMSEK